MECGPDVTGKLGCVPAVCLCTILYQYHAHAVRCPQRAAIHCSLYVYRSELHECRVTGQNCTLGSYDVELCNLLILYLYTNTWMLYGAKDGVQVLTVSSAKETFIYSV